MQEEDPAYWLWIPHQWMHIPCLIEILQRNRDPKNPYTNVPFTTEEIKEIETQAQQIGLFCPNALFRALLTRIDTRMTELEQLAAYFHTSVGSIDQYHNKLRDYVLYIAHFRTHNATNWQSLIDNVELNFSELEREILHRMRYYFR